MSPAVTGRQADRRLSVHAAAEEALTIAAGNGDDTVTIGTAESALTVEAGSGFGGGDSALPEWSPETLGRVPTVEVASAVYDVEASVLKNEFVDAGQTGGLGVVAADDDLVATLNGALAEGIHGVRTVQGMGREAVNLRLFEEKAADNLDAQLGQLFEGGNAVGGPAAAGIDGVHQLFVLCLAVGAQKGHLGPAVQAERV